MLSAAFAQDDIDARAEALEAVAKGQPKIALRVSGQVNRALMGWDDGAASDIYIADNIYSSSRTTLTGAGTAAPGLKAGFAIELEWREVGTSTLTAANDEGSAAVNGNGARTRLAYGWVESETLGRVSIGQLSPATNSLVYYNLWSVIVHTSPDVLYNTAFEVRTKDGAASGLRWRDLASGLDSPRGDYVQYLSPSFGGFRVSADWGENDAADAALTFDGTFGAFSLSAAVGWFREGEEIGATDFRGSALLKHEPSGIYVHGAYADRDFDAAGRKTARLVYGHAGVAGSWLPWGTTTLFAEAAMYRDVRAGSPVSAPAGLGAGSDPLDGSRTIRVGAGAMQAFAEGAVEVYGLVQHYEAEIESGGATHDLEPWQGLIIGTRVKF